METAVIIRIRSPRRLYCLCICLVLYVKLGLGEPIVNYKRHYVTSNDSDRATRSPRPDALLCRKVCRQVNAECSSSCYKPQGTAHTAFTTGTRGGTAYNVNKDDSKKYECMDRCLKQDEGTYVIPNSCEAEDVDGEPADQEALPKGDKPTKSKSNGEVEIELTTLTTKRRCQLQAYRNSTVCKFEDDNPAIAKKVFDANKPKLTLCTGGPVMSGKRGLYTRRTKKSFINWQEDNEDDDDEEEEDEDANEPTPVPNRKKRTRRNLKARRQRRSLPVTKQSPRKSREGKELCVTEKSLESPSRAIHITTRSVVSVYFYAGYSQWFEMGSCKHIDPVLSVNIKDATNVRCGMAMTSHKAFIMIEPAKMKDAHKFKGCGTVESLDKKYQVCEDWVDLPSHCKLFYS